MTEKTDKYGNKYWYLNGELHREDGPDTCYNFLKKSQIIYGYEYIISIE